MGKFNKVAIIGVGEIGSSIGKDLRKKRLAKQVIGIGRRRSSLLKAKKVGAVDKITLSIKNGVKDADLIILATPVGKIVGLGIKAGIFAKDGAIMTDVGSTKRHIVGSLDKALPKKVKFVGSHPMAGSEKRGPLNAQNDLFKGHICFVTRTKNTDRGAFNKIKKFWSDLGAEPHKILPAEHDRIVAQISQMIHIVASSLVISSRNMLKFVASGFRDTTRIASGDAVMWRDICVTNNKNIVVSLDKLIKVLKEFRSAISNKKANRIQSLLNQARKLLLGIS